VDVDLAPGRVHAVIGPSGAGKSTLLAVLAGLVRPDLGTVEVSSARPGSPPASTTVGSGAGTGLRPDQVGIIFQGYALLPVLTATENVELPLQLAGVDRAEVMARAEQSLARAGLADISDRLAEELSGGQRQRVAVARGLVVEAGLVIADEPTAELDAETAAVVLAALRAEAEAGAAVVVATNDPEVASVCDSVLHLHDGRVVG
jgi:putative ABC transport system ATP-binding protein